MRYYLIFIALLAWFALIAQLCLILRNDSVPAAELLIRYFSFFTIETNLLVAVAGTVLLLFRDTAAGRFFLRPGVQTAITVYIVVVALVYNAVLRFLWQPAGLQRLVDELLHAVVPVLFMGYWWFAVQKNGLRWSSFWPWLVYPLVYLIFVLVRGSVSSFYPYPFLEVDKIGFQRVLVNSIGVTVVFLLVSLLVIGLGKRRSIDK